MAMDEVGSLGGQDERNDESVQGQGFSEDEDQNHTHEDLVLLGIGTHASVTHDTDGQPCSLNSLILTRELKPQQSPEARWA